MATKQIAKEDVQRLAAALGLTFQAATPLRQLWTLCLERAAKLSDSQRCLFCKGPLPCRCLLPPKSRGCAECGSAIGHGSGCSLWAPVEQRRPPRAAAPGDLPCFGDDRLPGLCYRCGQLLEPPQRCLGWEAGLQHRQRLLRIAELADEVCPLFCNDCGRALVD